ncbi:MAG: hypothetical protein AB7K71_20565, partial [Polyangiaceae bacterium]
MRYAQIVWFCLGLTFAACGGDDDAPKQEPKGCDVVAQTGCEVEQVCEETVGGEPACYAPVSVTGRVFDTADDSAIEAALVVAR